jgi:hypothetical protein
LSGGTFRRRIAPRPTVSIYNFFNSLTLLGGSFGVQNQFFDAASLASSGR